MSRKIDVVSLTGEEYDALIDRAEAAESKVDAQTVALRNVRTAVEWGSVLAWITHGAVACGNTKEDGIQAARKVRIAVWAIDTVAAKCLPQVGKTGTSQTSEAVREKEELERKVGNAVEVLDSIRALLRSERHPDDTERIVEMVNGFLGSVHV